MVDVDNDSEGDADDNESAIVGDDVEEEGEGTKSPDANTQLLFVKPLYTSGSQLELP
jgi:hypothetical protein